MKNAVSNLQRWGRSHVVAQGIKPLLKMLTSYMDILAQVLNTPLLIQLLDYVPMKVTKNMTHIGRALPYIQIECLVPTLASPSPKFSSVSLSFQINK